MTTSLPRGPRGTLRTTYRVLTKPFEYLPRWGATYGDVFTVPTLNGDAVVAASPEAVRTIFTAPPDTFKPFAVAALANLISPGSLLLLDGERHRRERKLLMPPFHGDRMRAYAKVMADTAARQLALAAATGRVETRDLAQKISLEVIIRAVFGVQEESRVHLVADAVVAMVDALNPVLAFMPFLQRNFGGIGPFARYRRRRAALEALCLEQIERARAQPGEDILSLMLAARYDDGTAMSDEDIFGELITLLFAGHETTALSLTWAMDLVHRNPAVLARLQQELLELGPDAEPERYAKLPYLEAVCKETLRLYPVITEVPRMLAKPLVLGEHELSPGTGVAPCMLLVHYRPDLYPEPHAFKPERFLERKYTPFEYMPFGGGHRRCIGAAFAMFEMQIVLGTALASWQFQLHDRNPPRPVRRNFTTGPSTGVPVTVTARQAARAAA